MSSAKGFGGASAARSGDTAALNADPVRFGPAASSLGAGARPAAPHDRYNKFSNDTEDDDEPDNANNDKIPRGGRGTRRGGFSHVTVASDSDHEGDGGGDSDGAPTTNISAAAAAAAAHQLPVLAPLGASSTGAHSKSHGHTSHARGQCHGHGHGHGAVACCDDGAAGDYGGEGEGEGEDGLHVPAFARAPPLVRAYRLWHGANRFCCGGRLMTGPASDTWANGAVWFFLLFPSALYFGLAGPLLMRSSPAFLLLFAALFAWTVVLLLLTQFTDPGIVPRSAMAIQHHDGQARRAEDGISGE